MENERPPPSYEVRVTRLCDYITRFYTNSTLSGDNIAKFNTSRQEILTSDFLVLDKVLQTRRSFSRATKFLLPDSIQTLPDVVTKLLNLVTL